MSSMKLATSVLEGIDLPNPHLAEKKPRTMPGLRVAGVGQ
ncbi:hypothetical protein SAMN05444171_3753 [Bradyrhizobium lablabi]|uniref:Uncharacterized protein n=1 Tax=Bradyrhizobium lablabi TaxID=722472 RepID=A0A1M6ZUD8_9BRAD|nr:hypothetical protein SAMN05444171_3753 [Bradyrhizobium lablabi]SHL34108.1 hypothetical protein SAMN05444321_2593 [Bradyrhizobium lablabi]